MIALFCISLFARLGGDPKPVDPCEALVMALAQRTLQFYLDPSPRRERAIADATARMKETITKHPTRFKRPPERPECDQSFQTWVDLDSTTGIYGFSADAVENQIPTFYTSLSAACGHTKLPALAARLGRDPRAWSPEETSQFIVELRNEDARYAAAKTALEEERQRVLRGEGLMPPDELHRLVPSGADCMHLGLIFLGRLGYRNALALARLEGYRPPDLDAPPLMETYVRLMPHFPLEWRLYEEEWYAIEGVDRHDPEGLQILFRRYRSGPYGREQIGIEQIAYSNKRWLQTDAKAPHPDLERVRREIERLTSDDKQPEAP